MKIRCENCFKEYDEALGLCPYCGYINGENPAEAFCLVPGTVIEGRYIVGKMLGIGGFGITYKAWDKKLETTVAIKEYYPGGIVNRLPGESEVILVASKRKKEFVYGKDRFLEEARNLAKFKDHKNIVNVFDFFEANHTAYIVMEFLDGKTVSQTIQEQNTPLSYDRCIHIAIDICNALKAIHSEDILHRDISPDNIMLCKDGTTKLFDFGAARFSAKIDSRVTVVVKPGFAPPEQYDTVNRQDARTDIYALGATMYYSITGQKPEESTNRKIRDELIEPSQIDASIPQNLSTTITRAMAIEPQYRFANAEEFEKALLNEIKVVPVEKEKRRRKRKRAISLTVAAIIVLAIFVPSIMRLINQRKETTVPDANLLLRYILTGDEETDSEKQTALQTVIDNFTAEYDNVNITLDVEQLPYDPATDLESDIDGIIFETTNQKDIDTTNMSSVAEILPIDEETWTVPFSGRNEYLFPTGVVYPIIYVNSLLGELDSTASLQAILNQCEETNTQLSVSTASLEMYTPLFGEDIAAYSDEAAIEHFINREIFVYFGSTMDYFTIQKSIPGEYSVRIPECGFSTYMIGEEWSTSYTDEAVAQTANAFLSYLNSELVQDILHIQRKSGEVPILRNSLVSYFEVYPELSILSDFIDMPISN